MRPSLTPIVHHAAALNGDKIFLFGGSTRDVLRNDLIMLDSTTCKWQIAIGGAAAKLPPRFAPRAPRDAWGGVGRQTPPMTVWPGVRAIAPTISPRSTGPLRAGQKMHAVALTSALPCSSGCRRRLGVVRSGGAPPLTRLR